MTGNDTGESALNSSLRVTKVGSFLRRTRIDELPQLWNVLRGDYSLIGPRPELPALVAAYSEKIPYYNARHLLKPGLSGWAQIYHREHPHHGIDIEETQNKLSYDLYYVKNRSLLLDLQIGLKTIRTILSRSGA
jgi:lipopolysaccharide/colanic/teichoic acid biosynthesis glycosyltransferase